MSDAKENQIRTSKARVLVVDDDLSARDALSLLLQADGYAVAVAEDGVAALERVVEFAPDLILTDLDMPNMGGQELLRQLRTSGNRVPLLVLTGDHDLASAVTAMRLGAADYLTKPADFEVLRIAVERALLERDVRMENESLRRQVREKNMEGLEGMLGASPAMQRVYRVARQVANSRATVLITGESGTGKGEFARAIHTLSARAKEPFVSLHCAALADSLLESELFGHEKGAFTGADRRRAGRFEQANGGTLFLDEVGEIPLMTQTKLLQVLQERTFQRVGGTESVHVDVRVIAATNRNLEADVRAGRFREDLYFRLHVVSVEMPPLRLRGGDVLILANHFLQKYSLENEKRLDGFTDRARASLLAARWHGNVRELENAIERAVVLTEGPLVDADDLPIEAAPESLGSVRIPGSTMQELERYAIIKTLEATHGSTTKAAKMLNIAVRTIQYRLQEYGLRPIARTYASGLRSSASSGGTPPPARTGSAP